MNPNCLCAELGDWTRVSAVQGEAANHYTNKAGCQYVVSCQQPECVLTEKGTLGEPNEPQKNPWAKHCLQWSLYITLIWSSYHKADVYHRFPSVRLVLGQWCSSKLNFIMFHFNLEGALWSVKEILGGFHECWTSSCETLICNTITNVWVDWVWYSWILFDCKHTTSLSETI